MLLIIKINQQWLLGRYQIMIKLYTEKEGNRLYFPIGSRHGNKLTIIITQKVLKNAKILNPINYNTKNLQMTPYL